VNKNEALDLALAALECKDGWGSSIRSQKERAITAIKQARALDKKAENARELGLDYEPVAWVCYGEPGKRDIDFEEADINKLPIGTQLYTTPSAAKRQWVGLSDEEMQALWDRYAHMEMMRAIEAKLKEKNT
jgi:hypothetical protein